MHYLYPYPPTSNDIVVELCVSRSSTHKNSKWHMECCASPDVDALGAKNLHTSIRAIPVHRLMVRPRHSAHVSRIFLPQPSSEPKLPSARRAFSTWGFWASNPSTAIVVAAATIALALQSGRVNKQRASAWTPGCSATIHNRSV